MITSTSPYLVKCAAISAYKAVEANSTYKVVPMKSLQ